MKNCMAFVKIVFLPFAYTIDQFRWGLFNQSIPLERMNEVWWQLREKYQVCFTMVRRVS